MLSIGAFARLGEVSPRMLRHYDEIGLLSPERIEAGTGRALERTNRVTTQDIAIKHTQPLRIVEMTAIAPGPGPGKVGPVFRRLGPQVLAVLDRYGLTPGMSVGHYEDLRDDGSLVVHVGFEIDRHEVIAGGGDATVVDLPVVKVASLMHHGSLDTLLASNEQLERWVQDSGLTTTGRSRELYLQWSEQDPASNITELQAVLLT